MTLHERAVELLNLAVTTQGEDRARVCVDALDLIDTIRAVPPECRECPCYQSCDQECAYAPARLWALRHKRHVGAA